MADDLDVWDDAVDVDLELAARTQRKLHEMRLKVAPEAKKQVETR
jgi:hypothetical protein